MTKLGRNDPCHCGSGKKYKKCCADNDQQKVIQELQEDIIEDLSFDEEPVSHDDDDDDDDDDGNFNRKVEKSVYQRNESYPAISDEEQKLVDEWWDAYVEINSIEEIKNHLDGFIDKHPQLVENLGLEDEVLFELADEYRRAERTDEYMAFLMDFRRQFPATYARSAGYYDFDIIAWLISKGRASEIKHYLNYFIEKPVTFVDQLYQVIYLLLATGTTDEVIPLIMQVARVIAESDEVIYGEDIVHPLLIDLLSPYIKPDFNREDVLQFVKDLHEKMPYEIHAGEDIVDIWSEKMQAIIKPFDLLEETSHSKSEQRKQCSRIRFNFMRYLHETLNISWMSAQYYADLIYEYLMAHIENKQKKPKSLFDFSKKNIESLLQILSTKMYMFIDCTRFMSSLNAVHFFCTYLHQCGNFTTEEMQIAHGNCKSIHDKFYLGLRKEYTEALCFAEFPVYQ